MPWTYSEILAHQSHLRNAWKAYSLPPHKPPALLLPFFSSNTLRQTLFDVAKMGQGDATMRRKFRIGLGLAICAFPQIAIAQDRVFTTPGDPDVTESLVKPLNTSTSILPLIVLENRQSSCPNPSTEQFCDSDYCFLVQNDANSSWGTCCPAGHSLLLYGGENNWSTQRCCPPGSSTEQCKNDGISIPPMQPAECGSGGSLSGWGCVYGTENSAVPMRHLSTPYLVVTIAILLGYLV